MSKEEPQKGKVQGYKATELRVEAWLKAFFMEGGKLNLIRVATIVLGLFLVNLFLLVFAEDRAGYGDMFGAVNALFSGLAFAGIIVAIYLQSGELKLQREDLALTRDELRGQREQIESQNEILRTQSNVNVFFELFRRHCLVIDGFECIDLKYDFRHSVNKDSYRGVEFFDLIEDIAHEEDNYKKPLRDVSVGDVLDLMKRLQIDGYWHHYFASLNTLLSFTSANFDRSSMPAEFLRHAISSGERLVIFYHCFREPCRRWVENLGLLNGALDMVHEDHEMLYTDKAWNSMDNEPEDF